MQRGIELGSSVPTRQSGKSEMCSMEHWRHSRRTLVLRDQGFDPSVIDHLMRLFEQYRPASQTDNGSGLDASDIMQALSRIETKLSQS